MISAAGAILLALFIGSVVIIAMFLRLMWEDGEAVEICIDELEELDAFIPVNASREARGKRSISP
jgi:hypothetical protein